MPQVFETDQVWWQASLFKLVLGLRSPPNHPLHSASLFACLCTQQAKDTETFDHVKRDLRVEEDEDESAQKGAALRAMSEDQKRAMARLNTPAAAAVCVHVL